MRVVVKTLVVLLALGLTLFWVWPERQPQEQTVTYQTESVLPPIGPAPSPEPENNPYGIVEAPKALPSVKVYDYASDIPVDSSCEWIVSERGGSAWPKDAFDEKGGLRRLTADLVSRCAFPKKADRWEDVLRFSLDNFVRTPDSYRDWNEYFGEVMVAYGILQTGNNLVLDRTPEFYHSFIKGSLVQVYKSPDLQRTLYEWAVPSLRKAFLTLKPEDRKVYLGLLRNTLVYLGSYDHESERLFWEDLKAGKCRDKAWLKRRSITVDKWQADMACEFYFTTFTPKGVVSPERKIHAWVFRRIQNNEMGLPEIKKWLSVIISDLAPLAEQRG